jgi:hypothetical protein
MRLMVESVVLGEARGYIRDRAGRFAPSHGPDAARAAADKAMARLKAQYAVEDAAEAAERAAYAKRRAAEQKVAADLEAAARRSPSKRFKAWLKVTGETMLSMLDGATADVAMLGAGLSLAGQGGAAYTAGMYVAVQSVSRLSEAPAGRTLATGTTPPAGATPEEIAAWAKALARTIVAAVA